MDPKTQIEIPIGDLMKQLNDALPLMTAFIPFLFIGICIGMTRRILYLLQPDLLIDEKHKNEEFAEGESRKLKNDELPWMEEEKPKRTSHFELGNDGELIEVFTERKEDR